MTSGKALLTMTALAGLAAASAGGLATTKSKSPRAMNLTPEQLQYGTLRAPGSVVFAPDTTPEEMVEGYQRLLELYGVGLEHLIGGAGLEFNFTGARWPGTFGTPVNLTYSFPPDGTSTSNGANTIHATMTNTVGPESIWKSRFDQAINEWAQITGNTYTEVNDDGASWSGAPGFGNVRGDVRIVSAPIDGPSGVLAFNFFPTNGDMLLDNAENWGFGATDLFLRNVVSHEHGHGLGLSHTCPQQGSKLMEPSINTNFTGPQRDDRLAAQFTYGDQFEPNNSLGAATDLEALGLQSDVQLQLDQLSLRNTADGDFFRFEAPSGSVINSIQLAPQGITYLTGPQNANGSCSSGSPFDALRQLDVVLDLLNSAGQVITSVDTGGLGGVEELNNFALPAGGVHYIRVRSTGVGQSSTPIQEYRLRVNITLDSIPGDLNGDGSVNGTDLAILLSVWNTNGAGTGADFNGDGVVNGSDLATLLSGWTG